MGPETIAFSRCTVQCSPGGHDISLQVSGQGNQVRPGISAPKGSDLAGNQDRLSGSQ